MIILDRYALQFKQESWVLRLRGQALKRLGDTQAALAAMQESVTLDDGNAALLALAHWAIEQGDLQQASDYVQ